MRKVKIATKMIFVWKPDNILRFLTLLKRRRETNERKRKRSKRRIPKQTPIRDGLACVRRTKEPSI